MQTQIETEIRSILENAHPALFANACDLAEGLLGDEPTDELRAEFEAIVAEYAPAAPKFVICDDFFATGGRDELWTEQEVRDYIEFYRIEWDLQGCEFTVENMGDALRVTVFLDEENEGGFADWRESSDENECWISFPLATEDDYKNELAQIIEYVADGTGIRSTYGGGDYTVTVWEDPDGGYEFVFCRSDTDISHAREHVQKENVIEELRRWQSDADKWQVVEYDEL